MEQAGVVLDETEEEGKSIIAEEPNKSDSLENLSTKALHKILADVLETEDYERAAKIRDEIKNREEKDKDKDS